MKRVKTAKDVAGRLLAKGDTVATLNGQLTGRVWELAEEGDETFVQLRPVYQPYGLAVWYASDQVIWVATPARRQRSKPALTAIAAQPAAPIAALASAPSKPGPSRRSRIARKK